jgi:hypothetical protein
MRSPVFPQELEGVDGQLDVAVLASLAVDVQDQAVAVDVGDAEASPFEEPQPTDVDGDEADAVDGKTNATQDAVDLFATEDDGELLLPWRASETEQRPGPVESRLEKELDAAQGDGETRTSEVLHIDQIEEVLPKFLLADPVGRFVEVDGELTDGMDVRYLGSCGEPPKLHILDHALAEWRHGASFLDGGCTRPNQDAP